MAQAHRTNAVRDAAVRRSGPADLPEPLVVAQLLGDLLARDVRVRRTTPFAPHPATVRSLVDRSGRPHFVLAGDLALAHLVGAALAMVPLRVVAVADHDQPDHGLLECYDHVAQAAARALGGTEAHERLRPAHLADPLRVASADLERALCLRVDIAGYGHGGLALWALDLPASPDSPTPEPTILAAASSRRSDT